MNINPNEPRQANALEDWEQMVSALPQSASGRALIGNSSPNGRERSAMLRYHQRGPRHGHGHRHRYMHARAEAALSTLRRRNRRPTCKNCRHLGRVNKHYKRLLKRLRIRLRRTNERQ